MLFKQFLNDDLGCASYLIGDEETGEALVVDPALAIEQYREEAARRGVRLTRVLETHNHADHVSGHGRLALEDGLPVAIHPVAQPEYEFEPLHDGADLSLGEVTLRVVHTPGHRPEHCCFEVIDRTRGDDPWLVLTGDSLLVGDAARPDLAVEAREGARDLFRSLNRLLELPDGTEMYPGHVAGSLCGAGMSSKGSSTVGFERRFNNAFAHAGEDEFVEETAGTKAPRPPNSERIVALNRGPFVPQPPAVAETDDLDGAAVLDVRSITEYADGHRPGAVNVPVSGGSFPTKAAFVVSPGERIVLHASSAQDAARAAAGLNSVGYFELGGFTTNGAGSERMELVGLEELERLLADDAVQVIDVREPSERDDGYLPGSRNIPYRIIRDCADDLRGGKPVVTICSTGPRSAVAASVLLAEGVDARAVVGTGVPDWQAAGKPVVSFRRCG